MKSARLEEGQFVGSHYRSDYGPGEAERIGAETIRQTAKTLARCAARMRPGLPVYFAADTAIAIDAVRVDALELGKKNINITIVTPSIGDDADDDANKSNNNNNNNVTLVNEKAPLHIEFDKGEVHKFYPAFVDLLVMGNSMCQLYGTGGFGAFASLLSYNASCYYNALTCKQGGIIISSGGGGGGGDGGGENEIELPDKCCFKEMWKTNAAKLKIKENRKQKKEKRTKK